MRTIVSGVGALMIAVVTAPPAHAAFTVSVTETMTPQSNGFFYSYVLAVDPLSDYTATDFLLGVSAGANLSAITIPSGWSVAYAPGDTTIYWFAPLDGSADVLPGGSASFGFSSAYTPGSQAYSSFGFNYTTFDTTIADGTTTAPSFAPAMQPVPEPAPLLTLATGLPLILGWVRTRRAGRRADSPQT